MLYSIHPDIFCFSSGFFYYIPGHLRKQIIYIYIGKKLGKYGKERYLGGVVAASTLLV